MNIHISCWKWKCWENYQNSSKAWVILFDQWSLKDLIFTKMSHDFFIKCKFSKNVLIWPLAETLRICQWLIIHSIHLTTKLKYEFLEKAVHFYFIILINLNTKIKKIGKKTEKKWEKHPFRESVLDKSVYNMIDYNEKCKKLSIKNVENWKFKCNTNKMAHYGLLNVFL